MSVKSAVKDALSLLGKKNFVLAIHEQSFPVLPEEDTGRGSPYSRGGRAFMEFALDLGFTGLQFGPMGQVSRSNPSPYDSTAFSRNVLSISLAALTEEPWARVLKKETFERMVEGRPSRDKTMVHHEYVFDAQIRALREAFEAFSQSPIRPLRDDLEKFREQNRHWLERDALFHVLSGLHRTVEWWKWEDSTDRSLFEAIEKGDAKAGKRRADLLTRFAADLDLYSFCQFIVHRQHEVSRDFMHSLGLTAFGDLQIGYSHCDEWAWQHVFLKGYRMGAPPSRTNPLGQPWNYPILDPSLYFAPDGRYGPALRLVRARTEKILSEFDGIRIDHPHGLVCPWVYRTDEAYPRKDPFEAVQNGARLFSSPCVDEHPGLARYTIPERSQLNLDAERYADDWVRELSDGQVERYSAVIQTILDVARDAGCNRENVLLEVLSTLPFPLKKVMGKYGMGRFRVTQKADVRDPGDVYRSENARPEDWIMVGNHDTKPIWLVAKGWFRSGEARDRAWYLASRLVPEERDRPSFVAGVLTDPRRLAQAQCADLFASPASNVSVFMSDLFGITEIYNEPGVINERNWRLRLPSDYKEIYEKRLTEDAAFDIPGALAAAIRSRGREFCSAHTGLIAMLEKKRQRT